MAKVNLGRVKFSFQGDWNKNTNYQKDDVVWFNNINYECYSIVYIFKFNNSFTNFFGFCNEL